MTISILADNFPGHNLPSEHGLSYLIEFDGKRLLFDTGQSNLFLMNARSMGIDMKNIDMIILSHGHFDHGDGLMFLLRGRLICHPGCFVKRYRKADHSYIGLESSKEELAGKFDLITSSKPYKITEKILFLGEIPRITDFESKHTSFVLEDGTPDFVMDDSAVVLMPDEGLFVITGCGHSGIVNTLEHAKTVTGTGKLYGIMGGFHLKENNRQTQETIRYLKESGMMHIYPSHCTDNPALSLFHKKFNSPRVKTGEIFNF
jgi:7,8-dihydropterin-6-yl-methyl-4-(beta-D-ribofuranosyl)aminobenzene 5'-phosphate synthase